MPIAPQRSFSTRRRFPSARMPTVGRRGGATRAFALASTAALTVLAGCHSSAPAGEAIAIVDGRKLTRDDLAADLAARRLSPESASPRVRSALTSELVDRALLAEQAHQTGLDRDPDYTAMAARAQEATLVQHLLDGWRTAVPAPSRADVQRFTDSNPQMFADRKIYLLDEVQTAVEGLDRRALDPMRSMDAMMNYMNQSDHPFRRGSATFDTLTMGEAAAQRIAQQAPGAPFVSIHGDTLIIRSVVRSSPAPLIGDQGDRIAGQFLQRAVFQRLVRQKLSALRAAATITYPAGSSAAR